MENELVSANSRCEVVICLLSTNWESSPECLAEYRTAENMGKQIVCARLQNGTGRYTSEWEHTDLFADGLPADDVESVAVRGGPPVVFAKVGLHQLREAVRGAGIAADNFVWPPPADPGRAPYRGWEPFEELDAGVFFGRDAQIVRALDMLRAMRATGVEGLFVVLGPSGGLNREAAENRYQTSPSRQSHVNASVGSMLMSSGRTNTEPSSSGVRVVPVGANTDVGPRHGSQPREV